MRDYHVHLGSVRHSDGGSRHPADARIRAVFARDFKFGAPAGNILRSRDRWAEPELKGTLFVAVALPVLLYGSESWFIDAAVTARITAFYNGRVTCRVRSMCRLTRLRQRDLHADSTELLRRLRIQPVHLLLSRRQLQ